MPTTATEVRIETSLSAEAAQAVSDVMQPTLVELIDLALTTKQLHWAVVGRRFKPVHEHLDEVVDTLREYSDMVAEYLSTVAIVPDGRAVRVAGDAPDAPVDVAFLSDDACIDELTGRLKRLTVDLRQRANAVADHDSAAEDVLIEILRELDKHLWMTSAQR